MGAHSVKSIGERDQKKKGEERRIYPSALGTNPSSIGGGKQNRLANQKKQIKLMALPSEPIHDRKLSGLKKGKKTGKIRAGYGGGPRSKKKERRKSCDWKTLRTFRPSELRPCQQRYWRGGEKKEPRMSAEGHPEYLHGGKPGERVGQEKKRKIEARTKMHPREMQEGKKKTPRDADAP